MYGTEDTDTILYKAAYKNSDQEKRDGGGGGAVILNILIVSIIHDACRVYLHIVDVVNLIEYDPLNVTNHVRSIVQHGPAAQR